MLQSWREVGGSHCGRSSQVRVEPALAGTGRDQTGRERRKEGRIEREEAKRERIEEVKEGEKEVGREGGGKEGSPAPQTFPGFPGQL